MRAELKKRGISGVKAVWSKEQALTPDSEILAELMRNSTKKKRLPGSVSFVPSVVGLIIAGEVIKDLTEDERCKNGKRT